MSTKLLELSDRIVTDTGSVIAKYDLLIKKALSGEPFRDLPTLDHPDVRMYSDQKRRDYEAQGKTWVPMKSWQDNGQCFGPAGETYDWNIPEEYKALDVEDLCWVMLEDRGLSDRPEYHQRMQDEIELIRERDMFPFIQCLLYVITTFRDNKVVWGIGRGSSCASLVLFVLGINRVDPVKYDIPLEEFYK